MLGSGLCFVLMLTCGVYYIIYYYYILYIIHIISYYILYYTLLFFSSLLPLPISSLPFSSHLPYNSILSLFLFLSHPISSSFPFPILFLYNPLFFCSNQLIHSIRVGTWIDLFIFLPLSRQSDPACFIGVDG